MNKPLRTTCPHTGKAYPSSVPLSNRHKTAGGTGVLNIHKADIPMVIEAINKYGDSDLYISDPIWPEENSNKMAIHLLGKVRDLSGFWVLLGAKTGA